MIQATKEDLEAWREPMGLTKPLPVTVGLFLYQSALIVADYLQWCIWDPDNEEHVNAIIAAQCVQVSAWVEADVNPMSEGLKASPHNVQSASLLGGSFSNSGADDMSARRESIAQRLTMMAEQTLLIAGIHLAPVRVVG